jgi:hypothetical protein
MGSPPLLLDEIPTADISESVLPEIPANLVPISIATNENGNLLLDLSTICVELNSSFGIVEQPRGTIFFKSTVGRVRIYTAEGDFIYSIMLHVESSAVAILSALYM